MKFEIQQWFLGTEDNASIYTRRLVLMDKYQFARYSENPDEYRDGNGNPILGVVELEREPSTYSEIDRILREAGIIPCIKTAYWMDAPEDISTDLER